MTNKNLISITKIPKGVPKQQRARLIRIQQEKIRKQLKTKYFLFEPQTMEFIKPFSLDLEEVSITHEFADMMSNIEIKWLISCYILSRQKNSKNELTSFEIELKTPCRHSEIMEQISDLHWQQIEEFKSNKIKSDNFITAGWIVTEGREVPNDVAYKLFDMVGAWKIPADWEEENDSSKK